MKSLRKFFNNPNPFDKFINAVRESNLDAVEKYIKKIDPNDINKKDERGDTALTLAVKKNHIHIVKLLLENGADVNLSDIDGYTPLILAVLPQANYIICELLIKNKADLELRNNKGDNALHLTGKWYGRGNGLKIIELLIESGASDTIDNNGILFSEKYPDQVSYKGRNTSFKQIFIDAKEIREKNLKNILSELSDITDNKFLLLNQQKDLSPEDSQLVLSTVLELSHKCLDTMSIHIKDAKYINQFSKILNDFSNTLCMLGIHLDDKNKMMLDNVTQGFRRVAALFGDKDAKSVLCNFYDEVKEDPKPTIFFSQKPELQVKSLEDDSSFNEHKSMPKSNKP